MLLFIYFFLHVGFFFIYWKITINNIYLMTGMLHFILFIYLLVVVCYFIYLLAWEQDLILTSIYWPMCINLFKFFN